MQAASKTGVMRAELLPTLLLEHNGDEIPIAPVTGSIPQLEQYGYVAQLEAFLVAFGGHSRPLMDAAFGRDVLDVVCAAYASAREGGAAVSRALQWRSRQDAAPALAWLTAVARRRVVVSGRVQGVWYRDSCRDRAEMLGVRGWVANRSDGAVVAELEGDEPAVDALIAWMRTGPPRAVVTKVDVSELSGSGDWVGFRVMSTPPP